MPRPKSFDPDVVLAKAMDVFWEKGYESASISDLTDAMGINRFSLYDTFGDKRELYLKALDSYIENLAQPIIDQVNAVETLEGIEAFFHDTIDMYHDECSRRCCMVLKAAASTHNPDPAIIERIELSRDRLFRAFHDSLERIRRSGELRSDLDLEDASWQLLMLKAGLGGFANTPIPEAAGKAAVTSAIRLLAADSN